MKALIVVDYQVDFVSGALGFPGAQVLDAGICQKIDEYRRLGADIVFTLDTHDADYPSTREGKIQPVEHCIADSDGWRLYGGVAEKLCTADTVFIKAQFGSLELANYLRERGYASVELCGLVSHICLLVNAVLAQSALPKADIIIDSALTAAPDPALHAQSMNLLKHLHMTVK